MSTEGDVKGRIVRKVVITYTTAEDSKREQTLTLEHGGTGEQIDGIVWGDELIRKLAYLEGDTCREPKKGPGTGEWIVYSGGAARTGELKLADATQEPTGSEASLLSAELESGARTDCVWIHDIDCMWWSYCPK